MAATAVPSMWGKRTAAVRISDSSTSTPTTSVVKTFSFNPFAQGPNSSRSLQSSSRNTDALGSSTPARVWHW